MLDDWMSLDSFRIRGTFSQEGRNIYRRQIIREVDDEPDTTQLCLEKGRTVFLSGFGPRST